MRVVTKDDDDHHHHHKHHCGHHKVTMIIIIRMVTNDSQMYPRCRQQILLTATSVTCHPFFNTKLHLNNFDPDDCLILWWWNLWHFISIILLEYPSSLCHWQFSRVVPPLSVGCCISQMPPPPTGWLSPQQSSRTCPSYELHLKICTLSLHLCIVITWHQLARSLQN